MTDYCPRCAGLLLITRMVLEDATDTYLTEAVCGECHKKAVWNDQVQAWEPTVNRRFLVATAATFAILLWIVGHAEVIS